MTAHLTPLGEAIEAAMREGTHCYDCEEEEYHPDWFAAELDRLGYVVVPKEPTEEMVEAGRKAMDPEKFVSHARTLWVYGDMIVAAPRIGGEK